MNKSLLLLVAFAGLPLSAFAQNIQDQINRVDSVIEQQKAQEASAKAQAEKRLQAQRAAQQAKRDQEKKRTQAYQDKLRDIEIENMALELEAKRARVKRTNEYIDVELKGQAAEADVVQSEADAIRNISSGIGENLKSRGRAAEEKAKK